MEKNQASSRTGATSQLSLTHFIFVDYFYENLTGSSSCRRPFFEQLLFAIDQRIDVVGGQLEPVAMRDRVRGAGLHAIPAENTPRIINIVYAGVTLTCRNTIGIRIFRGFDVNAIRRAGRGAQKTPYALFQTAFIAMQHVNSPIARLKMDRLVRIILGNGLPKHIPERHAEPLRERAERLGNLADDVGHARSLANEARCGKRAVTRLAMDCVKLT